jgi:lipid A 4'-phosphatase
MRRTFLPLLLILIAAEALFRVWPGIDLLTSAAFFDAASGAWLGNAPVFAALRETLWLATELALVVFAALLVLSLARRHAAAVPARLWGFALLAIALGPGLLVNGILKANWGRARPRNIAEFGGDAGFTPAWQIADECTRNCSFVSGEVSGTVTVVLVIWLLARGTLHGVARTTLAALLLAAATLAVFLRIAAGAHFLSDSIFALLLGLLLTLAAWHLLGCPGAAPRLTRAALLADLRAPFSRIGRRTQPPPK